jgi:hypothetical protein
MGAVASNKKSVVIGGCFLLKNYNYLHLTATEFLNTQFLI